jgi:TonB family protein
MLSLPALAQTATKPSDEMERAQRDADKVFKMILINSDAPRKKRAPDAGTAPATAAAPAAAAVVKAPAATANSSTATAAAAAQRAEAAPAGALQVAAAPAVVAPIQTPSAAVLAPATVAAASVDDDDDDSPLVPIAQVRPTYRSSVLRELGKGTVRVKFEVQPDGSVSNQEVVSTSSRSLNSATLAAVGQWKFQPIKKPRQAQIELGFDVDQ